MKTPQMEDMGTCGRMDRDEEESGMDGWGADQENGSIWGWGQTSPKEGDGNLSEMW